MKAKELREMDEKELLDKIDELKSELRKVVSEIGTGGAVQNPMRKRELRKTIARAYTVLTEKRLKKK
ncbi:MAG: 50S ribosomal protein L29 [Candidatus Caldarchaeum sp.]|nr:50S ribosomal protein L29 [Candidatus Caldarchaeum sp.]MCS7133409.1 50S ribosomal protein L29 [Candidatus Caldarchaeum sp.]MCX8201028.1 50S ribosomal protein L29 [Candidatus Caldarchaeum sp.]MDW8063675.1 50S ribosomal protein L29 [Candidatus Caldarchaeum sp.]MDW8435875.1 50S ribosomal protein L29 [Candidatus Caldarchaeum sp.]